MPICNTDNFISQLQTKINTIAGDSCPWCQVSSGKNYNSAAIKTDGTLWTWGGNSGLGKLGDGTTVDRCSPGTIAGAGTNWCQVSVSCFHTAAIKTDGTLWTWGFNASGQLGDGTLVNKCSPGTVAGGGTTWCQVDTGGYHTAAIKTDGTLWTWGCNVIGQLGDGTTVSRSSPGTTWGSYTNWCKIVSSNTNTFAIKTDGTLWTWGCNDYGSLGDGTETNRCSPGTIAGGGTTWCKLSSEFHSAAIKTDGTLWTWGHNCFGALGDGTTVSRCSPGTIFGGGTTWCEVSVGWCNTISIKTDGTLWTWGSNFGGRLGDGTTVSRCSPGTVVGGGTTWNKVSSGYHTAAIKTDGTLWSWGYNDNGALGDGTVTNRCSPGSVAIAPVASAEDFLLYANAIAQVTDNRQVSVASSSELPDPLGNRIPTGQMVFLEDRLIPVIANGSDWDGLDGRAFITGPKYCIFTWGRNLCGSLGDGTTVDRSSPGTISGGGTNWCQVSGGERSNLAIKTDGTLWTWGCSTTGLLGNGTTICRSSPGTTSGGGTTWCQVSSSLISHTAAIKTDGTLWTWGCGSEGRLGDGTTSTRSSPGTVAGGGTTWCQVSVGCIHTAAIKTDGTIWTWGCGNCGVLGNGNVGGVLCRCSPGTTWGSYTNWCLVSSGDSHSLAIKTDGTLWTWGNNTCGRLGNGTTVARCSPGTVAGGGTNWCQVCGILFGASAIKTDGTLWTWGNNTCGSLGDGTTVSRLSPGTIFGGGTNWCSLSGFNLNRAAIKTDGTLWTWGRNNCGQLGDGTTVDRCSPGTIFGGGTNWCQVSVDGESIVAITRQ